MTDDEYNYYYQKPEYDPSAKGQKVYIDPLKQYTYGDETMSGSELRQRRKAEYEAKQTEQARQEKKKTEHETKQTKQKDELDLLNMVKEKFETPKKPEPTSTLIGIASHYDVVKSRFETAKDIFGQARDIDPQSQYRLEGGKVVTGEELRGMYVKSSVEHLTQPIHPGYYIETAGGYSRINPETAFIISRSDPKKGEDFKKSLEKPLPDIFPPSIQQKFQEGYQQQKFKTAYQSMEPEEKITFTKRFVEFEGGKTWSELKQEQPYLQLKVTKTGDVIAYDPRTQLDYSRTILKATENLPPVVKEIAQFGFGGISSGAALIKPFANLLGQGKEFDKFATVGLYSSAYDFALPGVGSAMKPHLERAMEPYYDFGIHYVTPLDFAFEPLGLSPGGSTELLKKYPAFTAGGVVGEIAQAVAFDYAIKGATTGVKIGLKGTIKRLPSLYGQFSSVFPEESFIPNIAGKMTTYIDEQSKIITNIYGWGAKGWQKGTQFIRIGSPKIYEKGGMTFKELTYKPSGKVWMTAEQIAAQKAKAARFGTIDIPFPTARIEAGTGRITSVAEVTFQQQKGLFSKRLVQTYGHSLIEKDIDIPVRIFSDEPLKFTYGGFMRGESQGVIPMMELDVTDIGKLPSFKSSSTLGRNVSGPEWYKEATEMWETGYTRTRPILTGTENIDDVIRTEIGAVQIDVFEPFGKIKPIPEKEWHQIALGQKLAPDSVMKDIAKNIEGTMSITPTITIQKRGIKTLGRTLSGKEFITVPLKGFATMPIGIASYATSRVTSNILNPLKISPEINIQTVGQDFNKYFKSNEKTKVKTHKDVLELPSYIDVNIAGTLTFTDTSQDITQIRASDVAFKSKVSTPDYQITRIITDFPTMPKDNFTKIPPPPVLFESSGPVDPDYILKKSGLGPHGGRFKIHPVQMLKVTLPGGL